MSDLQLRRHLAVLQQTAVPASAVVVPHMSLFRYMRQSWIHRCRGPNWSWRLGRGRSCRNHTVGVLGWELNSPVVKGVHHQAYFRKDLAQKGYCSD